MKNIENSILPAAGSSANAPPQRLAFDIQGLSTLQMEATQDPLAAARKVAAEFESLFLNMLLKTMRETQFDDEEHQGPMQSYQEMFDSQIAQTLAQGKGTGLGEVLAQQLLKRLPADSAHPTPLGDRLNATPYQPFSSGVLPQNHAIASYNGVTQAVGDAPEDNSPQGRVARQQFLTAIGPHAQAAAQSLGVAPYLVSAHAALESGWGKHVIRNADGSDSHNVFGIKAGSDWNGATTDVATTEYVNGVATASHARFRTYPDYGAAFADYAHILRDNPRYSGVLNQGTNAQGFARGLAEGGYATDPHYAEKLTQTAGATLRG